MLVLGIDPGLATTGYGLVRKTGDNFQTVDYGCIITAASLPLSERLLGIFNDMNAIIDKYLPDVLSVEQLFFCKNVRTALQVGQARGVIIAAGAKAGCPVYEYTPLQVKQSIAGYGRAGKKQVQQMIRLILGLKEIPRPDDAADALAIAVSHLQTLNWHKLLESQK
ncbi:MAG TPA: crossover junction endodeoxyribonuclease RuvC [Firmicutes bacterium]|jgi:crossover junction endodeoxyribonuclease RuvC|nr:crossover junction endodeoxyribonuclease RuvC [Bacillota bacterium]